MSIKLNDCLYCSNIDEFRQVKNLANKVLLKIPMYRFIGTNLRAFVKTYAEKEGVKLKILYLPFHDSQVWGMYYKRNGIFFIVINSEIYLNKQNVALAHEFYHFISSIENEKVPNYDILKNLANSTNNYEDKKANAFSSCLLMPDDIINLILEKKPKNIQEKFIYIKMIMDICVVPFKTAVIRLFELDIISKEDAILFLDDVDKETTDNIESLYNRFSGDRWQQVFENFVDLDDLDILLKENVEYEFTSENVANKKRKQVEEIIRKISNISGENE